MTSSPDRLFWSDSEPTNHFCIRKSIAEYFFGYYPLTFSSCQLNALAYQINDLNCSSCCWSCKEHFSPKRTFSGKESPPKEDQFNKMEFIFTGQNLHQALFYIAFNLNSHCLKAILSNCLWIACRFRYSLMPVSRRVSESGLDRSESPRRLARFESLFFLTHQLAVHRANSIF